VKTFLFVSLLALAGCMAGPTDPSMSALTAQLREAFPNQIAAISFENAPPLDPPTIFVDMAPGTSPEDELTFLCSLVRPQVNAIDSRIDVTTTYGYHSQDDCR
jgi:hypothetical protein